LYIVLDGAFRKTGDGRYIIIGALAIVLGFAFRDWFTSLIAGLLFDHPFQIGDRIKINGYEGEITSIRLGSVKMMTPTGQLVVVPNSSFLRQTIAITKVDRIDSPVEVEFILPNSIPLEQMEKTAKEAALTSKYVYLAKPVSVTSTDDFQGIFLTKLKVKASVFDYQYSTQFAEDIKKRVKVELKQ